MAKRNPLDLANDEVDRFKEEHANACAMVAKMHAAAVGEVTGPRRGVVEDVEDLRAERDALAAELERLKRERERRENTRDDERTKRMLMTDTAAKECLDAQARADEQRERAEKAEQLERIARKLSNDYMDAAHKADDRARAAEQRADKLAAELETARASTRGLLEEVRGDVCDYGELGNHFGDCRKVTHHGLRECDCAAPNLIAALDNRPSATPARGPDDDKCLVCGSATQGLSYCSSICLVKARHKEDGCPEMPSDEEMWADAMRALQQMGLSPQEVVRDAGEAVTKWYERMEENKDGG